MAKKFPYLEVSGSYYEVGFKIGGFLKDKIQERIGLRRESTHNYKDYLGQIGPYKEEAQKTFPKLIEELRGYADGAGVSFDECFLANTREVFDYYISQWEKRHGPDHCTIVVSLGENKTVVGHNEEDWLPEAIDDLYVLKANINGVSFMGLNYITELSGNSASLNSCGLVQCINTLYSDNRVGVPRNFLARAVLECTSLDETEKLIEGTKRASGFNHVLVKDREIRNVETLSRAVGVQRISGQVCAHTNHFLSPKLEPFEKNSYPGTKRRLKRARELVRPSMKPAEMISLLSDSSDSEYPICNASETIGSVVIIPEEKEVWVCYGHPCAGEFVKYTL